jgi:hypothetical protein
MHLLLEGLNGETMTMFQIDEYHVVYPSLIDRMKKYLFPIRIFSIGVKIEPEYQHDICIYCKGRYPMIVIRNSDETFSVKIHDMFLTKNNGYSKYNGRNTKFNIKISK